MHKRVTENILKKKKLNQWRINKETTALADGDLKKN